MDARILDGKQIAMTVRQEVKVEIQQFVADGHRPPGLAVIFVGDDGASSIYVRNKRVACEQAGIMSVSHNLPIRTTEDELLHLIDRLNDDPLIDGILVQLPLPQHIDEKIVIARIATGKDVDGFHPFNIGCLAQGIPCCMRPCTPKGIMTLLAHTGVDLCGLHAVVVGQSKIVGRPMSQELLRVDCTTTACHIHTVDLQSHLKRADILVVAIGKANFIQGDWIKPGAIVIDVGMNRLETGQLVGDVDFNSACKRAAWITPVPGGVGPMTVATLLQNTLDAAKLHV